MATATDITRKAGDTYPAQVTIQDADGAPFNLTGVTSIRMGLDLATDPFNVAPNDAIAFATGTVDTDPTSGKVVFDIAAEMAALAVNSYKAEIQFVQSGFIRTTDTFNYTKSQIKSLRAKSCPSSLKTAQIFQTPIATKR